MPAIREETDAAEAGRRELRLPGHAAPHRGRRGRQREGHRGGENPPGRVRCLRPPPARAHRRDPPLRVRHRHPGGGRSRGSWISSAPPACASRRTAPSKWTATRSKPAAASSTPAATSSPAPPTSSNAMGYGKKAARNIDERLMGDLPLGPDRRRASRTSNDAARAAQRTAGATSSRNCPPPSASKVSRRPWSALTAAEALDEACRCLRCDINANTTKGDIACLTKSPSASTANTSPRSEGQTILEVARASGKYIPTLCWLEDITPVGACRLCIVEVSGVNRLLPACTTPVQDGMSVTTNSEKLTQYRRIAHRVPLLRAQSPVRRLRLQQPLRAAGHGAAAGRHQRALPVRLPEAAGGRLARALRAGPQPLHPVHALRARVRRSGRRARLGRQLARHPSPWWSAT